MAKYFEFKNSVKICSGENALDNLSYELNYLKVLKPLFITDENLEKIGTLSFVQSFVEKAVDCSVVYDRVPTDSSVEIIEEIASLYKQNFCDGIIAVGGGSVIDTAKGVRMLLSQEKPLHELMGNEVMTRGKQIPFVVIPTTSGTGSEATCVAVIADRAKNKKLEFISYELLPDLAVLDTRMTLKLPPRLTVSTGVDALCHAIEAYSCNQKNPLSDAYAISAVELIGKNLLKVVENPKDAEARQNMANASLMAGVAFSNSMVGLVHAIAHACGGVKKVPHGNAIAVLLPHVLKFNLGSCGEEYSRLLLHLAGPELYAQTPEDRRPLEFVEQVEKLLQLLSVKTATPLRLSMYGVVDEDLSKIADTALVDGAIILNRVPASRQDILTILKKSL